MNEKQIRARVSEFDVMRMDYWCSAKGMSRDQFVHNAVEAYIRELAGDFRLPDLYLSRQNQMVDSLNALNHQVGLLQEMFSDMQGTLTALVSGDDYLND